MPCYTDPPTDAQLAETRLRELVNEVEGRRYDHRSSIISSGSSKKIQEYTRLLCAWCKAHPKQLEKKSLELQMWWRDHQAEDVRHERERLETLRKEAIRQGALAKLTKEEREALGLW